MGAIIGYITNWLAIKMLFRPHEEKFIFGMKVPFTPGLIPKEQKRIAKSVGKAVGEHLLSEETVVEALSSEKVHIHLKKLIENKVDMIANESITIREVLDKGFKEQFFYIQDRIKNNIEDLVMKNLKKPEVKEKIKGYIKEKIAEFLQKDINQEETMVRLKEFLKVKALNMITSEKNQHKLQEGVKAEIYGLCEEGITLKDITSEGVFYRLEEVIMDNKAIIAMYINNMVKEPEVEEKLRNVIDSAIASNVNPLVAMFLNNDNIYNKVISFIEGYLKEEKNQEDVVMVLQKVLKNISYVKIAKILDKEETLDMISKNVVEVIAKEKTLYKIITLVGESVNEYGTLENLLGAMDENFYVKIDNFISITISQILNSKDTETVVNKVIENIINKVLDVEVKNLIVDKVAFKEVAVNWGEKLFNRFIKNEAVKVIALLDISQIVEEQITKFPVAFAEEIIVDIARKELNAITWLGALLGGLIGILSPVIAML